MPKVAIGEYATIIKSGTFDGHAVQPGMRCMAHSFEERYSTSNRKFWADVSLINADMVHYARIKIPSWWLRPRTVLDDLAAI